MRAFQTLSATWIRGISAGLGIAALSQTGAAKAIITFTASEVGPDVVFSYSGSANTASLVYTGTTTQPGLLAPSAGFIFNTTPNPFDVYSVTLTGPTQIGPGTTLLPASSSTGDPFGLVFTGQMALPTSYSTGSTFSGSSTFLNESFASLGITPGTYTWTWGTGPNADSAVLTIGPTAAPGPLPLFGAAAAFTWSRRLRRRCGRGNIAG